MYNDESEWMTAAGRWPPSFCHVMTLLIRLPSGATVSPRVTSWNKRCYWLKLGKEQAVSWLPSSGSVHNFLGVNRPMSQVAHYNKFTSTQRANYNFSVLARPGLFLQLVKHYYCLLRHASTCSQNHSATSRSWAVLGAIWQREPTLWVSIDS